MEIFMIDVLPERQHLLEIAIVGGSKNPWSIDAEIFNSHTEFLKQTQTQNSNSYNILILYSHISIKDLIFFLEETGKKNKTQQIILIESDRHNVQDIYTLVHQYPIVALVKNNELDRVQDLIYAIMLSKRLEDQKEVYQKLLADEEIDQERQYQSLVEELSLQQEQIVEVQNRLVLGLQQEKLLHDTLLIMLTSQSLTEIELRFQEILKSIMGAVHIKIVIHPGTNHPPAWGEFALSFDLYEKENKIGSLVVTPLEKQNLSKYDRKTLENIAEALSLQVPRFTAHEAQIALESEWRSTFDSISDPLIIVSDQYEIIEANKAARYRMEGKTVSTINSLEPCYKQLFQRNSPCDFCRWGKKSNLESHSQKPGELWEMSSHEFTNEEWIRKKTKSKIYIHLYRNKFHQMELEEKLKTFSQAAEVGIFKASLAHELNNPIGGLLTLAQLQKMDLSKEHTLYPVILKIEKQALLCRDLIQNLLQKSREKKESSKLP